MGNNGRFVGRTRGHLLQHKWVSQDLGIPPVPPEAGGFSLFSFPLLSLGNGDGTGRNDNTLCSALWVMNLSCDRWLGDSNVRPEGSESGEEFKLVASQRPYL